MLKISETLSLPLDTITQRLGIIAVSGAGKSNLAAVMAEEMFSAHLPFVVIDPFSAWWGLRSSSDGKGPGLLIPIFGGKHGDIPLEPGSGHMIADLIMEKRLSCVLDLDRFNSEAEKTRFLLDFADRLFKKNENPLHLFLEEADDYIPQKPMDPGKQKLLSIWENIVRRGRGRGLGVTLITQRSAVVNKDVLNMIETLFVLRTTGPNDIDAVERWIKWHQQDKKVLETLSSLRDGEAWCWSPKFLKTFSRHQIRRRTTFDSGATPKNVTAAQKRPPATLADIDLSALKDRMAETIEKAKAEDPKELHKQIAELKNKIAQLERSAPKEKEIQVPILSEEHLVRLEKTVGDYLAAEKSLHDAVTEICARLAELRKQPARGVPHLQPVPQKVREIGKVVPIGIDRGNKPSATVTSIVDAKGSGLTPSKQRILNSLARLEAIGVASPTKVQLALWVGQSPKSSTYTNYLGALRTEGLLDYPSPGTVCLTESGRSRAVLDGVPTSERELHEQIYYLLTPAKQKIIKALISVHPNSLSKEQLAEMIGQSVTSSTYTNYLGALRSMGLLDYPSPGQVRAENILFLR